VLPVQEVAPETPTPEGGQTQLALQVAPREMWMQVVKLEHLPVQEAQQEDRIQVARPEHLPKQSMRQGVVMPLAPRVEIAVVTVAGRAKTPVVTVARQAKQLREAAPRRFY